MRGNELAAHQLTPEPADDDVDDLDPDERQDDPAEPVDEEVAAQDGRSGGRAEAHAAKRERDERDDDRAR